MKKLLIFVSLAGLLCVIVPPIMYLAGNLDKSPMSTAMLVGTLLWFASAPLWMGKNSDEGSA